MISVGLAIVAIILLGRVIAHRKHLASITDQYYQTTGEIDARLILAETRLVGFKRKEMLELRTAHSIIPDLKLVEAISGDTVLLSSITGKHLLLYRFSESSCIDCVIKDIEALKKLSKRVPPEQIIAVGNYSSSRSFKAMINSYSLSFLAYNYTFPLGVPLQSENYDNDVPFYLVIRPDFEVILPYSRDDEIQNQKYLERIAEFFERIN